MNFPPSSRRCAVWFPVALSLAMAGAVSAAEPTVSELAEQNRLLKEQLRAQQQTIDALQKTVDGIVRANEQQADRLKKLDERSEAKTLAVAPGPMISPTVSSAGRGVVVSGVAGLAWFDTGPKGAFPHSEFRVDEAKVFVEAAVWKDVYFLAELDLQLREGGQPLLGEAYVDFERAGAVFGWDRAVNFRAGRLAIPFGEEYLRRDAINNPLISHTLADAWGIDEGFEIYGEKGAFQYVLAVQNGGHAAAADFNADKSVTARLGWDPRSWLHLSGSAFRTGKMSVAENERTEIWLGNGVFSSLGDPAGTREFWATMYELNGTATWRGGYFNAAAGLARYDDDDRTADNAKRLTYFSAEAVQSLTERLYGAVRYSRIEAPKGFPLSGYADVDTGLSDELWRLSLALGYRFGEPLVWKVEYTREDGSGVAGRGREAENVFATEIGLKF